MPIYEYRCMMSNEVIERFINIGFRDHPTRCNCGNSAERILSPTPTTFRFNDRLGFKGLDKRTRGT